MVKGLNVLNNNRNGNYDIYSVYDASVDKAEILKHTASVVSYFYAKDYSSWKYTSEIIAGIRKTKKLSGMIKTNDYIEVKPDDLVLNEKTGELFIVVEIERYERDVTKQFNKVPSTTTILTLRGAIQ